MTPDESREMIPEYLAGRLSPADKAEFEKQMHGNAELLMHVEELRATWQEMGRIPMTQPSAAMRASFYRRVSDMQTGRAPVPRGTFVWWKPGLAGLVRQVAVAVAIFAVGLFTGRAYFMAKPASNTVAVSSTDAAQLQSQIQSLRQTVALSLLERQSPASRLEGVSFGSQVDHPDQDLLSAMIQTLEHDSNVNVRLAALDALEKFSGEARVRQAMINALGHQDSPLVQIALIDALVHMREKDAAGEFSKLSTQADANAAVRQRAQWALKTLKD